MFTNIIKALERTTDIGSTEAWFFNCVIIGSQAILAGMMSHGVQHLFLNKEGEMKLGERRRRGEEKRKMKG